MQSQENLHEKYQVMRYGKGMIIDTRIKLSMTFSCSKVSRKSSCIFIGTGIGMPMYSGNKFLKFWLLEIWSHREFPGKSWIKITKVTVTSSGLCRCIQ